MGRATTCGLRRPDRDTSPTARSASSSGSTRARTWKPKRLPWKLEVEFSSQKGAKYGFNSWEFGDEGDQPLELAYALTIHKSQGSEFETVLVVVPNPCRLLSPELLYTALTRQRRRIVLLHQGPLLDLKNYSEGHLSETARRLTNLFEAPAPVQVQARFLEDTADSQDPSRRGGPVEVGSDHRRPSALTRRRVPVREGVHRSRRLEAPSRLHHRRSGLLA